MNEPLRTSDFVIPSTLSELPEGEIAFDPKEERFYCKRGNTVYCFAERMNYTTQFNRKVLRAPRHSSEIILSSET